MDGFGKFGILYHAEGKSEFDAKDWMELWTTPIETSDPHPGYLVVLSGV